MAAEEIPSGGQSCGSCSSANAPKAAKITRPTLSRAADSFKSDRLLGRKTYWLRLRRALGGRSMKAYQLRAPGGGPNLRIRKLKEKKPSAETRREHEAPAHLEKIRKLPCCIPAAMSPLHHMLIISNARESAVSAKSHPTDGRSRFAANATSTVLSASEAVRKPHGSVIGVSSAWTSPQPFLPTLTA